MPRFPRSSGFVQSLRLRSRALGASEVIVVVEGTTDKRALLPFLGQGVIIVPARGKEEVIAAFDSLEPHLRTAVLFVIDCDGATDGRLKGHRDLIITANRDIEADLVFELRACERVAHELLGVKHDHRAAVHQQLELALTDASRVSRRLTLALDTARGQGLPCGLVDRRTRLRRRLRVADLPDVATWRVEHDKLDLRSAVADLQGLIGWSGAEAGSVVRATRLAMNTPCRVHSVPECDCGNMRLCNGHHLVGAFEAILIQDHGLTFAQGEIDRAIRMGADRDRLDSWVVATRIRVWEAGTGRRVLA